MDLRKQNTVEIPKLIFAIQHMQIIACKPFPVSLSQGVSVIICQQESNLLFTYIRNTTN